MDGFAATFSISSAPRLSGAFFAGMGLVGCATFVALKHFENRKYGKAARRIVNG